MKLNKLLFILLIFLSVIIATTNIFAHSRKVNGHFEFAGHFQANSDNDSARNSDGKNSTLATKDVDGLQNFNPNIYAAEELFLIYRNDTECDLINTKFFSNRYYAGMLNVYYVDSRSTLNYLREYLLYLQRCKISGSEVRYLIDDELSAYIIDVRKRMITFGYFCKCSGIGMDAFCLLTQNLLAHTDLLIMRILENYSNNDLYCRRSLPTNFLSSIVNLNNDLSVLLFECKNFTSEAAKFEQKGAVRDYVYDGEKSNNKDRSTDEDQITDALKLTDADQIANNTQTINPNPTTDADHVTDTD